MKNVKCDKDLWSILIHIGMINDKTFGHPYDIKQPLGKNATVGLEKIMKYYLLNFWAKHRHPEIELDIDPELTANEILKIIEDEHKEYIMNKMSEMAILPFSSGIKD